jgi:type VI secretion system ImpB/VipA family protein
MVRNPNKPGLPRREQNRIGQQELLATTFEQFELEIRRQLGRMLAGGGFDPAADIVGITVNRWPYGYSYTYDTLADPDVPPRNGRTSSAAGGSAGSRLRTRTREPGRSPIRRSMKPTARSRSCSWPRDWHEQKKGRLDAPTPPTSVRIPPDMRFDIELGKRRSDGQRTDTASMRILIVGDLMGASAVEAPPVDKRPLAAISVDTFDAVFARFKPSVALPHLGLQTPLTFESLDDFHPDKLFARVGIFDRLFSLRQRPPEPVDVRGGSRRAEIERPCGSHRALDELSLSPDPTHPR